MPTVRDKILRDFNKFIGRNDRPLKADYDAFLVKLWRRKVETQIGEVLM
jgi:hypothetical protein